MHAQLCSHAARASHVAHGTTRTATAPTRGVVPFGNRSGASELCQAEGRGHLAGLTRESPGIDNTLNLHLPCRAGAFHFLLAQHHFYLPNYQTKKTNTKYFLYYIVCVISVLFAMLAFNIKEINHFQIYS